MFTVYLVDDEPWIIIGLKKLIDKSGLPFTVVGDADNGVLALEGIKEKMPDLVFSDIRMNGLSGIDLLKQINAEHIDTKLVFISGYAEFEYARSALHFGAYDYLLKPVELEQLQKLLYKFQNEYIRQYPEKGNEKLMPVQINRSTISKIIAEIQEHYTENITLTSLSEKYGISVGHLSKLLKEEIGLSFSEYITSKRIQKARELLQDETLSIDNISDLVGYSDYFYFTKVFKRYMGISPSKYRKTL